MTTTLDAFGTIVRLAALPTHVLRSHGAEDLAEAAASDDGEASVCLIEGPLTIDGDLRIGESPRAIVVDGSLTVGGTFECLTEDGGPGMLLVTGQVRAANLFFGRATQVAVGSLEVAGYVIGTWGDGGAWLSTRDALVARGVLLDAHTPAFGAPIHALVLAATGWRGLVPDVLDGESPLFVPGVCSRGGRFLDFHAARVAARAGNPVFDAVHEATWRARKGL